MTNQLQNLLFILQLEEYDTDRFQAWIKKHKASEIKQQKKQLVWTIKARIIYLVAYFFNLLSITPIKSILMASSFMRIVEQPFKLFIITLAHLKLLFHQDLLVIGITGSYAKTSVKEILYHLLSSQYKTSLFLRNKVLKTPESYNTPLGIAKIILTQLSDQKIFIVEMGAYKKGDIKKLCDFVKPKIGILTTIGKQHLERFGSFDNIIKAKSELLFSLPRNGLAVVNADNFYCQKVSQNLKIKTVLYSLNNVYGIKTAREGCSFKIKTDGGVLNFQTRLLGRHNIGNILAAVAVARYLNISWEKINNQVSTLSPISHRLELIKGANNTTVIDDAYNANPDSVRAALEVLTDFDSPRKIVVTPGLVELGKEQNKENEIMGQEISQVADYLIIVGNTNKEALKKGFTPQVHLRGVPDRTPLVNRGKKIVIECHNLTEATNKLAEIVISNSVILFENDLPDQYL